MELKFPDEILYSTEFIETNQDDVEIHVYENGDVEIWVINHSLCLTADQLHQLADFAEKIKGTRTHE